MKILLAAINAKYIHSNLAVYSLRACAGEYRPSVELAEYTINNQRDDILREIYQRKPDVLCFSCYIWNIDYVDKISREFHKLRPEVPIWVGGPEVSYEVEDFLTTHTHITGVVIGEGEETFRELCGFYHHGGELEQIAGIAFRKAPDRKLDATEDEHVGRDASIVVTGMRPVMDMNRIVFCYEDIEDFSNRIIYYESSRGCPFSCSYCLSSVDKALRFRGIELVKRELQFFLDHRVSQVKFVDRTFNCNHAHAMAIWQYIREHDNGVTNFHFEISADLMNEEELALIAEMRAGLIQLEIGVQSTNQITIQEIHRTMRINRLKEVVQDIQEKGNIHEHLDLIAGLPYEDYESFRRSFDEIYALKPDQLQLGFLKVLKGSYLYAHAQEYGIVYHEDPPYEVLSTNWLCFDDVLRIKQVEEMLEVYYNSGQFEVTMKLMDVLYDSAFDFYQRLGDFYAKRGYFSMSHTRLRRCEILLEFLQEEFLQEKFLRTGGRQAASDEAGKENLMEMIGEALVFDLYYRENCKSRPHWATDVTTLKEMTHRFCKNGRQSHIEPFHYRFPDRTTRTIEELPTRQENLVWVLFHYDDRDPLTHQARIEFPEIFQLR